MDKVGLAWLVYGV